MRYVHALLLSGLFQLGTPTPDADCTTSNPALESIRAKYHLPGVAAARISPSHANPIAARAVGTRKFGNDTRLTIHDKFHLGSLTKAMTSTLVAVLISDTGNRLTWNTTVADALPDIGGIAAGHANTTLAMLGAHFSGINDAFLSEREMEFWLAIFNQTYTPVESRKLVAEKALSYEPLTTPGRNHSYSNVGYMILGHLIDTHSPNSCGGWEGFIQEKLWLPLGMNGCGFGPSPQRTLESIDNPWPHRPGNPDPVPVTPDRLADNPPAMGPAGTVHCTISSYAKFLSLHLDGLLGRDTSLLPAEAFEVLHTPYLELVGRPGSEGIANAYTPGAWIVAEPDKRVKGRYLLHDGSNTFNYALGVLAPGVKEAYFSGTNVGGDLAATGLNEALIGFFDDTLGF